MSGKSIIKAIDAGLELLNVNKICYLAEDNEAYYMTGCGDHGEVLVSAAGCKVDKKTGLAQHCYYDDPAWKTPKKAVEVPKERNDAFALLKEMPAEV